MVGASLFGVPIHPFEVVPQRHMTGIASTDFENIYMPIIPVVGAQVSVFYKGRGPFPGWVTNIRNGEATVTALWDRGSGVLVLPKLRHKSTFDHPEKAVYWC